MTGDHHRNDRPAHRARAGAVRANRRRDWRQTWATSQSTHAEACPYDMALNDLSGAAGQLNW